MKLFWSLTSSIFFLTLIGCTPNSLCEKDLVKYILDSKNGLTLKEQKADNLLITCSYRDTDMMFKDDSTYSKEEMNEFIMLKLTVEHIGNNAIDFFLISKLLSEEAVSSVKWFSANTEEGNVVISNVQPVSYLGTASKMDYLITIVKHDSNSKQLTVKFSPEHQQLKFLEQDFTFKLRDLNNIPKLSSDC